MARLPAPVPAMPAVRALAVAALVALVPPAVAAEEVVPAPYTGLDLVTGTDYAPFTSEDLPGGGMVTDLVRRAFDKAGRHYDLRFLPWKRGYDGVVAGRFLATFPYVRTPEREREVLFSDPVMEVRQFVYLSNRSAMAFHGRADGGRADGGRENGTRDDAGLEDFRGRAVCAPVGYALPPVLERMVRRGDLLRQTPSDLGACVRMVATGRADALVIDEYAGGEAIARSGLADDIRVAEQPFDVVTLHLVVGRDTPGAAETVAIFNNGLAALKADGVYRQLLARYTVPPPP